MGRFKMNKQQFFRPGEEICQEPLHYKECGLDNIYLNNGFSVEELDGEKYLTIKNIDGLHRAIGMHIVMERKAPTGKELRFLRNELDMSQADLARILSVSDQSVARWEKERVEANGAAVFGLRLIYLLSLLPENERSEVLSDILIKLQKLSDSDETTDDTIFSYKDDQWHDLPVAA
jgi:DNA-binding transcriptional regulator YiaG